MKEENEFVLPEKWALKVNEEVKRYYEYYSAQGYHHSSYLETNHWDISIRNGYDEITFDQFKEHVLKEPNEVYSNSEFNSESKIIGYKLIKEEYREVACKIAFYGREGDFFNLNGGVNFKNNSGAYYNLREAGVMHWFEPVFEEKKIKLTSGIELTEKDIEEVKEILKNK